VANFCPKCGRPKDRNVAGHHVCDVVRLADGRVVHADRVAPDGDLHDARVEHRVISHEMRAQMRKGNL
jgi:hypothetical protein